MISGHSDNLINPIETIRASATLLDHIAHKDGDIFGVACHEQIEQLFQVGTDLHDTVEALVMPEERGGSS
jgi:hypothetical protein